ncbi:REF/SRPP-like protein At3g05500 isoform X2 [Manihot esculenta]|uniref:REF/SRPP-like protein At3g05500 isoform X2 n=1 Tax=Manihot esculenta TaxID=3983 RepID=UPI000B5D49FC|nr:REF/SRPP-like protein At3g05500 isoform X2 [Manihot esculenta]
MFNRWYMLSRKVNEEEEMLKYLGFVQVGAIYARSSFKNLYVYAKDKSGPFKPGVETVAGTVKNVVRPVYHKSRDVSNEVLKFVDRKVDETVTTLDRYVPEKVKQVPAQAYSVAREAPGAALAVASEVQRTGVIETASGLAKNVYTKYEPTVKELQSKYEPKAEEFAANAWRKLNELPLVPQAANVVVPTAAYFSEKYNETVRSTAEKGFRVSSFLPLVPTERIAKVFGDKGSQSEPVASS